MSRNILHEFVKGEYVLPQPADDEERAVPGPLRAGLHNIARLLDLLIRVLPRVAEDELTRPEQVLARLALVTVLGILAQGQDIVWVIRNSPAHTRLRHTVEKTEMLMP